MADYRKDDTTSWDARSVRRSTDGERAPVQRNRRRRRRSGLVGWAATVVVISCLLAGIGWLLISDLCAFNKDYITASVQITAEDTVSSVASKLKNEGLIKYKWFFKLFAGLAHADEKIGVGTYELNTDMDYRALIMGMHNASGNLNTDTVQVTIPEGYTVAEIIHLLAEKGVNTEEALTEAAQTATFDYDFIDNSTQDLSRLEGYLFPDTYDFYLGEKPANALRRLINNFEIRVDEDRMDQISESGRSLKEIITIASLIEKETDGTDQDKIASVIYNRLNGSGDKGGTYGYLQIDASLLYALPDHQGAITNQDKEVKSAYNLYKNTGLPPTPIANPGLAAIDAAINPADTDYYYYALDKTHHHRFFTNFQDHDRFVKSSEYVGN